MSPITTIQYIEAYCCHLCSCISNTRRISLHALSIRPRIPICISRNLHAMENGASCSTILQRRGQPRKLHVLRFSPKNFVPSDRHLIVTPEFFGERLAFRKFNSRRIFLKLFKEIPYLLPRALFKSSQIFCWTPSNVFTSLYHPNSKHAMIHFGCYHCAFLLQ